MRTDPPQHPRLQSVGGRGGVAHVLRTLLPVAAILLAGILLQFGVARWLGDEGAFYTKLLLDIGINIVLAVSLTMVNGFTGQFSIGHAAFMAVGAYAAGGLMYYGSALLIGGDSFADPAQHAGLVSTTLTGRAGESGAPIPFITGADALFAFSLLLGGLLAAGCGYLVGMPSLRLRGDYLAIVTLGFGEIVRILIQSQTTDVLWDPAEIAEKPWYQLPHYLGGPVGFTGLPFYTSLFWVALACGATLLVACRLKYSTYGRAFLAIREDEIAAEAMGVNTTRYKVLAFVLAAFFAGIAGGLYAHTVGVQLNANELGFVKSFDIIIMVVLGGLGSISGSAMAAAILTILPELLRDPPSVWPWGLVVVVPVAALILVRAARPVRALVMLGLACVLWEAMRIGADRAGINLSEYRMVLYALALILMMILRPRGLMGVGEVWDASIWRRAAGGRATRRVRA